MNTRPASTEVGTGISSETHRLRLVQSKLRRPRSTVVTWVARAIDITLVASVAVIAPLGLAATLALVVAGTLTVWSTGLSPGRLAPRVSDEISDLVQRVALAMVVVGLIVGPEIALVGLARWGMLLIGLTLVTRAVLYELLRRLRSRGIALDPVVVVGAGPVAVALVEAMEEHPECGLVPVGFVDHNPARRSSLPNLGRVADLATIMDSSGARHALFAFGMARESEMIATIRHCNPRAHYYVLHRFFELGVDSGPPALRADIAGFPVLRIRPAAPGHPMLTMKRVFDIAASLVGLILLAPVMVLSALAVRLSSPGPILFRQTRVGRDGETFEIIKYRSMTVNDDSDVTWSVEADNRVTPVGRFLRASHFDELPQLINVLRGDMSLVGPRPERPFFVEQFGDEVRGYRDRHRVKSGITGWSQINGLVGDSSIEERARCDNWYIEHWSFWSDLWIVLRTVPTMSRRNR
jgi:exopolysaccharide biosynthesis polyprenyl glycosylphosphotransferase